MEVLKEDSADSLWCVGKFCQDALERMVGCPFLSCLCLLLAALMVVRALICLVGKVCRLGKHLFWSRTLTRYGDWAVITGASDGIGKAMTLELVETGATRNVLLIARNEQKLLEVAAEVEKLGGTARRLVVDFAKEPPRQILLKVAEEVKSLDVGILINNAGVSYPHAMYAEEVEVSLMEELLAVNVRSLFVVTQAILPGMKERGRGLIINVGSGSSLIPSDPLYGVYAATKAAVESYSRCLKAELASSGVYVQTHAPLLVTTKISKCKTPGLFIPSEKKYAAAAVSSMKCVGGCSPPTISPYRPHALMLLLIDLLPRACWDRLRLRQSLVLRAKAEEKKGDSKKNS